MMRTEDKDFFTLIDEMILQFEHGTITTDAPLDGDAGITLIFSKLKFEQVEGRLASPLAYLASLLASQHENCEAFIRMGIMPYQDGQALFMTLPHDINLDVPRLRQEFELFRSHLSPKALTQEKLGPFLEDGDQICLGPRGADPENAFADLIQLIASYNEVAPPRGRIVEKNGSYYSVFNRMAYAQFLRNGDMLTEYIMPDGKALPVPGSSSGFN